MRDLTVDPVLEAVGRTLSTPSVRHDGPEKHAA
jgi:hypothetical protein